PPSESPPPQPSWPATRLPSAPHRQRGGCLAPARPTANPPLRKGEGDDGGEAGSPPPCGALERLARGKSLRWSDLSGKGHGSGRSDGSRVGVAPQARSG